MPYWNFASKVVKGLQISKRFSTERIHPFKNSQMSPSLGGMSQQMMARKKLPFRLYRTYLFKSVPQLDCWNTYYVKLAIGYRLLDVSLKLSILRFWFRVVDHPVDTLSCLSAFAASREKQAKDVETFLNSNNTPLDQDHCKDDRLERQRLIKETESFLNMKNLTMRARRTTPSENLLSLLPV